MTVGSDFFNPTIDEIKNASKGGGCEFKAGEEVTFLVKEVTEGVNADGSSLLKVVCQVLSGENKDKPFTHFIRNNATSKGIWINMLKAFFDEATMTSGTLTPMSLVGKQMMSVCKVSKGKDRDFYNFYQFEEVGGAPNLTVVDQTSDIPF